MKDRITITEIARYHDGGMCKIKRSDFGLKW